MVSGAKRPKNGSHNRTAKQMKVLGQRGISVGGSFFTNGAPSSLALAISALAAVLG
jgi:hypothetical protein